MKKFSNGIGNIAHAILLTNYDSDLVNWKGFNSLNEIKDLFKKATQKGHILFYVTALYNHTNRCQYYSSIRDQGSV